MRTIRIILAAVTCAVLGGGAHAASAPPVPDRKPAPPLEGDTVPYFGRAALRLPPRQWVVADAANVVDASELVVLVPDETAADAVIAGAEPLGYAVLQRSALDALGQVLFVLRIPAGRTGAEAIAEIESLDPRATAGVNHAYSVPRPAAALERFRYAEAMIGWPADGCAAKTRIGLIDTAIDPAVAATLDARIETADFRRDPARQGTTDHGTGLAELLAGQGRLVSPEIYNAIVVGDDGAPADAAGVESLLQALDWLVSRGVRVANVSLAGPYNKLLDLGVQSAAARGLVIVAAVGNDGPDANPRYPAAFDEAIAVTAVDADDRVYENAVRGPHVDLAAPGVDVVVQTGERTRFMSGTSVAVPYVTALLAADGRLADGHDLSGVIDSLEADARDVGDTGRDDVYGAGILWAAGHCP